MSRKKTKTTQYLKLESPFVGLPIKTIQSPELNSLSVHARWLYVVILTRFTRMKSKVEKEYSFTYEDLREITGFDDRRITACVRELEESEFLTVVHGGKNNPSLYQPILKWLY